MSHPQKDMLDTLEYILPTPSYVLKVPCQISPYITARVEFSVQLFVECFSFLLDQKLLESWEYISFVFLVSLALAENKSLEGKSSEFIFKEKYYFK